MKLCLLLILIVSQSISAQNYSLPENLVFIVNEIKGKNLSPESSHIAASLSRLVLSTLAELKERNISGDEYIAMFRHWQNWEIEKQLKNIQNIRKTLHSQTLAAQPDIARMNNLRAQIRDSEKSLTAIEKIIPQNLLRERKLPLKIHTRNSGGTFVSVHPVLYQQQSKAWNYDYLIGGTVEELEGALFIELFLYSRYENAIVKRIEQGGSINFLDSLFSSILGQLRSAVLARDWADISISVNPSSSRIYLDRIFKGVGSINLLNVLPGEYTLLITHPNFQNLERTFLLEDISQTELVFDLAFDTADTLRIQTEPSDAKVYVDTVFQAYTPVDLTIFKNSHQLRIIKDGYKDTSLFLRDIDTDMLSFNLLEDHKHAINYAEYYRNRMYSSFALGILCLPITMFLYDNALSYQSVNNPHNINNKNVVLKNNIYGIGTIISATMTVTLGLDFLFNSLQYLNESRP